LNCSCEVSFSRWARAAAITLAAFVAVAVLPTLSYAQDSTTLVQTQSAQRPGSLIDAWLSFPELGSVEWPFAYLRADTTSAREQAKRKDLFKEFDQLGWRLKSGPYRDLAGVIDTWRSRLSETERYREPGDWSPAWLMAHPSQSPPLSRVAAIGACEPPSWVEVWDSSGIERVEWQSGLALSDLSRRDGPLELHGVDQVAVVTPEGAIAHYGQAAFNYSDTGVSPGTRVIAALPLGGEAFPWIRDTIAHLLAHTPAGSACRELNLVEEESRND